MHYVFGGLFVLLFACIENTKIREEEARRLSKQKLKRDLEHATDSLFKNRDQFSPEGQRIIEEIFREVN